MVGVGVVAGYVKGLGFVLLRATSTRVKAAVDAMRPPAVVALNRVFNKHHTNGTDRQQMQEVLTNVLRMLSAASANWTSTFVAATLHTMDRQNTGENSVMSASCLTYSMNLR